MKANISITATGSLTRALSFRSVSGTDIAEGTLGVESTLNGRKQVNYLPIVIIGKAAKPVFERTQAGSVVNMALTPRQEKWETDGGDKRSRTRLQALRTEVLTGDFTVATDKNGGYRLQNGVNNAMLGGNLVASPTLRKTPGGDTVTDFSLALNEKYKDRQGNEQERVTYVDIVVWNDLAEKVAAMPKGTPIIVTGCAISESWSDDKGQKRSALKFEAATLFQVSPPNSTAAQQDHAAPVDEEIPGEAVIEGAPQEDDLPF